MTSDDRAETTQELVANAAEARDRVASDVERLAEELTPAHLKTRALDAVERSLESLAARVLQRLAQTPRRLASYVREHPVVGVTVAAGAAMVVWRFAIRRHR